MFNQQEIFDKHRKFTTNIHVQKCLTNVKRNQNTSLTQQADAQIINGGGGGGGAFK